MGLGFALASGPVAVGVLGAAPSGVVGSDGAVGVSEVPGLSRFDECLVVRFAFGYASPAGNGAGGYFGCPFGAFFLVAPSVSAVVGAAFAWHGVRR